MDKLVYVREVRAGTSKLNQKVYPIIVDQDGEQYHLFNQEVNAVRINTSYLFTYEVNEKGYKDIHKITPLVNIFHQRALREVSNKNDLIKNISICVSYSISLVVGKSIPLEEMFPMSDKIYNYITSKADSLLPPEEVQKEKEAKEK